MKADCEPDGVLKWGGMKKKQPLFMIVFLFLVRTFKVAPGGHGNGS
jgi:hypothetical protein